jgi:mannose-6-phosphate isomerase-like protein (cupin superfamily)
MQPKISVPAALSQIKAVYTQKLVASVDNAYDIKVAKIAGDFVWHSHPDADELFYILSGSMVLQIENSDDVALDAGDIFVVPKGVRHRPMSDGADIMIVEKAGVVNTGDLEKSSLTVAPEDVRDSLAGDAK